MGIAIGLVIGWIALMARDGAIDVGRVARGQEPTTIERFRTRHKEKQEKAQRKLGKGSKEPGPIKKYARALADNAAAKQIDKSARKLEAHRRWVEHHKAEHDQMWFDKWDRKLRKKQKRLRTWGERRGAITPGEPIEQHAVIDQGEQQSAPAAGGEQSSSSQQSDSSAAAQNTTDNTTDNTGQSESDQNNADQSDQQPEPAPATTPEPVLSGSTPAPAPRGGNVHYMDYVRARRDDADETRQLASDLVNAADNLASRGLGARLTEAIKEVSAPITEAAGHLDDAADMVQDQGDRMHNAYDEAPEMSDEIAMA